MVKQYMVKNVVLSLFPGIDGLGIGFEKNQYCVVRSPDLITGGDIRDFKPVQGMAEGVIAGPPCQGFSGLNRNKKPKNYSHEMLNLTARIIETVSPEWALIENVVGVPDISIEGYKRQTFTLDYAWFSPYARLRVFQFFCKDGQLLNPMKGKRGEGAIRGALTCYERDTGAEAMRDIQGFPKHHKLPLWTNMGKKRAYGNAVPVPLAEYVAKLIRLRFLGANVCVRGTQTFGVGRQQTFEGAIEKRCDCGCGRVLIGRQRKYASDVCRWKGFMKRKREVGA